MSMIHFTSTIAWIVLTAFLITQDTSSTDEIIPKRERFLYKTVHQNAQVVCDFPAHRETISYLNAFLLRGVERTKLSQANWNNSIVSIEKNSSEFDFSINVAKKEKYAAFHLKNLLVNHTDSYICKIEVIDPPPYGAESSMTFIYVKEPKTPDLDCCPCTEPLPATTTQPQHCLPATGELPQPQERLDDLNMPITIALGVFVFYSMIITAAVCYHWLKSKKNRVLQNDYFNMMPWQSNGPRKRPPQLGVPVRNYTAYRSWEP